jgi:hypothetical protein
MILNTSGQLIHSMPIITNEGNAHVKYTCYLSINQKQF